MITSVRLFRRVRSFFLPRHARSEDSEKRNSLADATKVVQEMRGDHVSPQPAGRGALATDNVAAAAKDYGLSRFSGETDALGSAAKSYRASKTRRQRKRQGR